MVEFYVFVEDDGFGDLIEGSCEFFVVDYFVDNGSYFFGVEFKYGV